MQGSHGRVLMLPYTAASVGVARRRLIGDLAETQVCDDTVSDAALVLSELISNALLHARPLSDRTLRVAWQLGARWLEVAVSDGGGTTEPAVCDRGGWAVGGRGLGIVEELSQRWGVSDAEGENTVWAELPVVLDSAAQLVTTASGREA
jgi:anti-sigma regulatory factor (Ser/Thr protein kinase)